MGKDFCCEVDGNLCTLNLFVEVNLHRSVPEGGLKPRAISGRSSRSPGRRLFRKDHVTVEFRVFEMLRRTEDPHPFASHPTRV
jgi:hypothetical protein